ncbi:hypothetical protein [Propionimicrobium lymphophilum]|nr:hypothetical protein [Propionimicrobium lymphophilum]
MQNCLSANAKTKSGNPACLKVLFDGHLVTDPALWKGAPRIVIGE